jgi:hypothetical protein
MREALPRLLSPRPIMQFQFDIASTSAKSPPPQPTPLGDGIADLLRAMYEMQRDQLAQILEVQKEQLNHARAQSQENLGRWRHLLSRWETEHPDFAEYCKRAYPILEKSYVQLLVNMVEEVADRGEESLDNEFGVQEFLDRFGARVGQLSHLMSIVGPLSEAAAQLEAAKQPK